MYQILAYGANNAANAVLADTPAIPDPSFVTQNNHWLFYENYELDALFLLGTSLTAAQLFTPTLNSLNVPQIYPPNLSLAIPSNPQVQDLRQYPLQLPMNAQIACQLSNNLSTGNEWEFLLMFISPFGQARQLPAPAAPYGAMGRIKALFTVTSTLTAGVWSPLAQIVIPNLIMQGTWCITGAQLICASRRGRSHHLSSSACQRHSRDPARLHLQCGLRQHSAHDGVAVDGAHGLLRHD